MAFAIRRLTPLYIYETDFTLRVSPKYLGVSVENGQLVHDFYEKPCASKFVIPHTSAHSKKMKMAVLVEEGVRRLRNASPGLEWERSRSVMEKWSRKLREGCK